DFFTTLQTYLVERTDYGIFATKLEESLFQGSGPMTTGMPPLSSAGSSGLPVYGNAPEFTELGPWHNSPPLTVAGLRGKVVLVDFWTYSCINCIRTLPYVQGYWDKYKGNDFVLVGVHTPEFTFEQLEKNVAAAIKKY